MRLPVLRAPAITTLGAALVAALLVGQTAVFLGANFWMPTAASRSLDAALANSICRAGAPLPRGGRAGVPPQSKTIRGARV